MMLQSNWLNGLRRTRRSRRSVPTSRANHNVRVNLDAEILETRILLASALSSDVAGLKAHTQLPTLMPMGMAWPNRMPTTELR
jgi:hypothetical protein